jgi:hypothetical protein
VPGPKLPRVIGEGLDRLQDGARQRQLSLPFLDWAERMRAAPNAMLRSALFGVVKPGRRQYVEEMALPMIGDFSLAYTGKRLDQSDLDIYLQIVHYARQRTVDDDRVGYFAWRAPVWPLKTAKSKSSEGMSRIAPMSAAIKNATIMASLEAA